METQELKLNPHEVEALKTVKELRQDIKVSDDVYRINRTLQREQCKIPIMPFEHLKKFGLEKHDSVACLLESYYMYRTEINNTN